MAVCLLFIHLESCVEKVQAAPVMPLYKNITEPGTRRETFIVANLPISAGYERINAALSHIDGLVGVAVRLFS